MQKVLTLIDKATEVCSTRYALAKRLGVDESNLSKMARGKLHVPASLAARLADIAGLDPTAAAAVALIEGARTPEERAHLERIFSSAGAVAVSLLCAAVLSLWPSESMAAGDTGNSNQHSLYIMSTLRRWLRSLLPTPGSWRFA